MIKDDGTRSWHEKWWIVSPATACILLGIYLTANPATTPRSDSLIKPERKPPFKAAIPSGTVFDSHSGNSPPVAPVPAGYSLPKSIVEALPSTAWDADGLDRSLSISLSINEVQKGKINELINSCLPELYKIEALNSELREDPSGDQYFEVKPFSTEAVSAEIKIGLKKILNDDRADFLYDVLQRSSRLSYFGKYPQEIFIERRDLGNGVMKMEMRVKFDHQQPNLSRGYSIALDNPTSIEQRFGNIYRKAGLSLFEK